LEITPPRIAPFVKRGNDFRWRSSKIQQTAGTLRALFWRCPMQPGKINSRRP
jgi:hypothetical protein